MSDHVKQIICLTENFPDGQHITGAQIIYDKPVDIRRITPAAFKVKDRRITGFSANDEVVTLNLDPSELASYLVTPPTSDEPPKRPEMPKGDKGPDNGPPVLPTVYRNPVVVEVMQKVPVFAEDGTVLEPFDYIASTASVEPVVSEFIQDVYEGIPYNLYIPKEYDGKCKLPLVLFIHDAGPCGPDVKTTLSQGSGPVSFASSEWQKDHPCFVLAPQIDRKIRLTGPNFTTAPELFTIKAMADFIVEKYGIDENRIYTTGQSMGCMSSCQMNILWPDYFAASLLVAGQWDPVKMAEKCTKCKFWILVSENDARAFPGMNAVTEALEEKGVKVGHYWWDAKQSNEELNEKVKQALEDDVQVRYTVFYGSSVVPANCWPHPGANHVSTWNRVYPISGLKEWLFSCSKE